MAGGRAEQEDERVLHSATAREAESAAETQYVYTLSGREGQGEQKAERSHDIRAWPRYH